MALKGNLKDFSITQLLNLINLANKTGLLVIEGPGDVVRITFRDGKLAHARIGHEDDSLATILRTNSKISSSQYRMLRERAGHMTDKELGLLLINAGYVSRDDIIASLQVYFVDVVRRLFTWVEGFFHFEANQFPPDDKIAVRIDLENLIIEGSRQMRELEQLQEEIPSLDMALKFTERPGTNIRDVNLSVEEWKVVSYVNPKNTMRQIARATHMNDLEIRRVVFGLLQAGLVEIVRPGGAPIPNRAPLGKTKEEQVGMLSRLITRIRSI